MLHAKPRLLIVGCGDVGLRVLAALRGRWQVFALSSQPGRRSELRAAGARPLVANLDQPATLGRLGGLADAVLHLAPPPASGDIDSRSLHLMRALARGGTVQRLVYASTSGVYGDCGGAVVDETRALAPATARARRRAHAEALWRWYGRRAGVSVTVLRVPGIYAPGRAGGDPQARVRAGVVALRPEDDVYTNHIHADDLARACVAALSHGRPQRVLNVSDDTELKMGDYFDAVARHFGLPASQRVSRAQAEAGMSPQRLSFMSESRRLDNRRLKAELRLRLHYPTVLDGLGEPAAAR